MKVLIALVLLVCFAYGLSIRRPVLGLSCGSLPPKYQTACLLAKKALTKKSAQTESDFLGALSIGMKAFKAFKAFKAMKKQKKQKKQQQEQPESDFLGAIGIGMKAFKAFKAFKAMKKQKKQKKQQQEQPESDAQFFKRLMSWYQTKGKKLLEKGKNAFNKGKEIYAILKNKKQQEQPAEPEADAEFFAKLKKWWSEKGKNLFEKGKNLFNKGKEIYSKGKEIAAILKSFKKPKKQEEQPQEQPAEEPVNNDAPQDDVESDGPKSDAIARAIVSRVGGSTTPKGRCAQYSREAIEAATGLRLERKASAKDYGSSLLKVGFRAVSGPARAGDVAIFQAIANHPHGHMQINGGSAWYSDFKQRDVYAGPGYRNIRAPYQLYRLD